MSGGCVVALDLLAPVRTRGGLSLQTFQHQCARMVLAKPSNWLSTNALLESI